MSHCDIPEEGIPPSPQSRVLPVRLSDSFQCYCHEIDWLTPLKNGGRTAYNYTDGTPCPQCTPTEGHGMPCGDRVNLGNISVEQAMTCCRYWSWDDPDTKMPRDLIDFLKEWDKEECYDSRFDIQHPDHYLNHYSSLKELMEHLQDPSLHAFSPIQGTTDPFQAQMEINQIEELKRASLSP